jgi:hypothetical protein
VVTVDVDSPYVLGEDGRGRVMTIIYIDADLPITTPTNDHQRSDLAHWQADTAPHTIPNTPLNPVIYPNPTYGVEL